MTSYESLGVTYYLCQGVTRAGKPRYTLQARRVRFTPVMRFVLLNEERRTFYTRRWRYLGRLDDRIDIGPSGPVRVLARRFVPLLGTDALFDVIL